MGSEQSQQSNNTPLNTSQMRHPANTSRLTRGNTIAVTGQANHTDDGSPSFLPDSSPPISVCSDSDLPYISYTDKPIGGKLTKLKIRKIQNAYSESVFTAPHRFAKVS